jgi:hypothetical protein
VHTFTQRTGIGSLLRRGLPVVAAVLAACSSNGPTEPGTQELPDSVALVLSAAQQRLDTRRNNSDSEWTAAQQDWQLYQQGWQKYQAQHPQANADLLRCEPEHFVGEAKVIGAAGGTIEMGEHRLVIPKGALSKPVVITGELTTGPLVAVDLSPHGLTFAKPVLLQVGYSHCQQAAFDGDDDGEDEDDDDDDGAGPSVRHEVVYVGADETVLERVPSTDDEGGAAVSAWLSHFSRYAVYY